MTLPPTRTGAGGGGGGGTLPPSKPEPVQVEKPELTAPLSVPKDIAKIVDTAPPSGASGARSGVVGGATTGLPGVSVGDVFFNRGLALRFRCFADRQWRRGRRRGHVQGRQKLKFSKSLRHRHLHNNNCGDLQEVNARGQDYCSAFLLVFLRDSLGKVVEHTHSFRRAQ